MIDIENQIFDGCARLVLSKYPECMTSSANVAAPASFPAVSVTEGDNATDTTRIDSSGIEKGALLAYDVRVYSNLRKGAKAQAKDIAQMVDGYMNSLNFTRSFKQQGFMASDSSVYQVTMRFIAGVDNNEKLYRR